MGERNEKSLLKVFLNLNKRFVANNDIKQQKNDPKAMEEMVR
jgi:hypothetical protein